MPATASTLPKIAFSKNPVNLEITSTDYIAVNGVAAIAQVTFSGAIAAGNTFRLLWANADLTLTAAVTPDDSGIQFPTGSGNEAHVRAVMAALAANPYIDEDFELSYVLYTGEPSITFTAKKTGVLYNLAAGSYGNISVDMPTAGVNLEYKPNFYHHLEIWLKVNGAFTKIYSENLAMDAPISGVTTKDIAEILNAWVAENTDRPDLSLTGWQSAGNTLLEYYVKFGQFYGDNPTIKKLTTTASAFINLGGLSPQAALNQTMSGYLRPGGVNAKTLCLRQGSKVKNIQAATPEYLYWVNLTTSDINIQLRVEMFFTTGGSQAFITSPQLAVAWQKYYIAVGYNALNISASLPGGKICKYYTVTVIDGLSNKLSLTYSYVIDRYREWPRYFIYSNSLGGYSTLYTYGKGQASTDRTKNDIKKVVTLAQAATDGSSRENNIRIQQKCTVNTGYTSQNDIELLNDFMVSPEKYYYDNGQLIPIGLTTTSINLPVDGENTKAAAFEFYPLYDGVVFTSDLSLVDNSISGSGSGNAPNVFNKVRDDGQNNDALFYDKNII